MTGTAGGVTEAIVRALSEDKSEDAFAKIEYSGIRSRKEFREAEIQVGELTIKAAVVCGLKAADELAEKIVAGESIYDFVEVSVCPDGCVSGGGQITSDEMTEKLRAAGLYYMDKTCALRSPEQNESAMNFASPEFTAEFAEGFRSRLEKEQAENIEPVEEEPVEEPIEETAEAVETVEEVPAEEPIEETAEAVETVEEVPAEEPTEEVIETSNEEITDDPKDISRGEGEIAAADDITDDIEEEPLEELFEEDASESASEDGKDEEENVEEILTEQGNSVEESVNAEAESEKDTLEDILDEVAATEDTAEETQETEDPEEAEAPFVEDSVGQSEEKAEDTEIAVEEITEEITAEESEIVNSSNTDAMEPEETSQDIDEEELNEETKENSAGHSPEPYHRTLSRKERRKLKRMRKFRN